MLKTIFFVAFEFPPANNGGVYRPYSFAKYLSGSGYRLVVFTLHPDSIREFYKKDIRDDNLLKDLPPEVVLIQIPIIEMPKKSKLKRFFEISDRDTENWEISAEWEMTRLKELYTPQALVVTAPPFTIALFGKRMAALLNLPFILDMRDAWTYWNLNPYRSWFHYYFTKRLERSCFEKAVLVTATSSQTISDFKELHPSISDSKFHLVTNGYEELIEAKPNKIHSSKKIIIGYCGGFYYDPIGRDLMFKNWWKKKVHHWLQYVPRKEDWLYRSPYFFFRTFRLLLDIDLHLLDKVEIHFIGQKPDWFDSMVKEFSLGSYVKHLGSVSHEASLNFQKKCDFLLLTSSKVINGKDYSIAGKTFEYISMQKPILGFVCEGAQRDLLEKTGLAVICNPDKTHESALILSKLIKGELTINTSDNFIKSLSRKNQASKFENLLNQVIS